MRRYFVLAACLCLLAGNVSGQALPPPTAPSTFTPTGTSAPTLTPSATATATASPASTIDPSITLEPLRLTVNADLLFPAGIIFRVDFQAPLTGVESITLTVTQPGWAGETIEIDPADVAVNGGAGLLFRLWDVPDETPALFEPVTFTWEVLPRGRPGETAALEFTLSDPRFAWTVGQSADAPVMFAVPESRTTASVAQAQISSLARLLGAAGRPIAPLKAIIFPSDVPVDPCVAAISAPVPDDPDAEPLRLLRGENTGFETPCESDMAQRLYTAGSWEVLNATNLQPVPFVLTRTILYRAYPDLFAGDAAPEWFKSGLVAYFAGAYSENDLASAQAASRSNLLLRSLDTVPTGDREARQWQAQSLGTVIYMSSQIGVPSLLEMIDRLDAGEALADVWPDVSGQVLDALLVGWGNWIFTPQSEAAYRQQPSLDPTTTPTPTITPTPTHTVTPSATPSPTLTPTITLSPTVTPSPTPLSGFAPPTAAPTLTPSITPPPTVTPRAGDLFELGEIPSENPPQPGPAPVIVIGLAAAALILLIAIILIFRRR